jgi:hypothetical protein
MKPDGPRGSDAMNWFQRVGIRVVIAMWIVAVPATGMGDALGPAALLDAIDARAAQMTGGDLTFTMRRIQDGVPGESFRWWPFLVDGRRFATQTPHGKVAYDGSSYGILHPEIAEATLKSMPPEEVLPVSCDPRYFNNIGTVPRVAEYLRANIERATLAPAVDMQNVMVLQVIVPKDELEQAFTAWADACRHGAVVSVWVGMSEALPLLKMEMRGGPGPYEGMLGTRVEWLEWGKRDPGVWVPKAVRVANYAIADAGINPGYMVEFDFDDVDLTKTFPEDTFQLVVPAGYKVIDSRGPMSLIYIKGDEPHRTGWLVPEATIDLDHLVAPSQEAAAPLELQSEVAAAPRDQGPVSGQTNRASMRLPWMAMALMVVALALAGWIIRLRCRVNAGTQ